MKKDLFEKIVEAPAQVLEKTEEKAESTLHTLSHKGVAKRLRLYWKTLGPGLVTGAADDDPSGIATYSQTGAKYGFQLLWMSLITFPLMATVQETCARIALVTGRGLASNIKQVYSKKALAICTLLLFVANALNIGADLGAMAKSVELLAPRWNFTIIIITIGVIGLLLEVFLSYKTYAKYLKWITLVLFSYVISLIIVKIPLGTLLSHLTHVTMTFSKDQILIVAAVLGTTISPYLFFWQSAQEVEEEIAEGKVTIKERRGTSDEDLSKMRIDVWSGMFFSNFVMFSIIAVCAATLFQNGITNIDSASQAAEALRPLAGNGAYLLFALGIVGTGLLAIPVLAGSTSYAASELFNWKEGLNRKLHEARAFYGVIIISVIVGIILNFLGLNPIKMLLYAAVVNGIVSPVMLVFIMLLGNNKKVMGRHHNRPITNIVGWIVTILMGVVSIVALISLFIK